MAAKFDVEAWFSDRGREDIHEIPSSMESSLLTRGAFGEISIGLLGHNDGWRLAAIKTIVDATVSPNQLRREVFQEICALRLLEGHPNVVPLISVYPASAGPGVSLAFPYRPVDLHVAIEWRKSTSRSLISFPVATLVSMDVLSALEHCHSHCIVHRDVKPGNILIGWDGVAQLCDFGLAKPFGADSISSPSEGETKISKMPSGIYNAPLSKGLCTLFYRPPEALLGGSACCPASDMFSFGLVLAEMVNGVPVFPGSNVIDQLSLIFDLLGTPTTETWPDVQMLPDYGKLSFPEKVPKRLRDEHPRVTEDQTIFRIVRETVKLDPNQRLTTTSALEQINPCIDKVKMRRRICRELVPSHLQEPLLLSCTSSRILASKQALRVASSRRTIQFANHTSEISSTGIRCRDIDELCQNSMI